MLKIIAKINKIPPNVSLNASLGICRDKHYLVARTQMDPFMSYATLFSCETFSI